MRPVPSMAAPRGSTIAVAVVIAALLSSCGGRAPSGSAAPTGSGGAGGPTPIVIDTDLGADDILAIAILLRDPSLRVEAITLSGTGLVHCDPGLDNLWGLLHQLGVGDVPIACGSEDAGPDGRAFPDAWRAGTDAAYGLNLAPATSSGSGGEAADVLAEAITTADEQTTIVELGPWTNLESLFAANPGLVDRVTVIHAMGGTLDAPGNVADEAGVPLDPSMEWNLAADPSAVASVLGLGIPLRFVALDATDRIPVDQALYQRLRSDHAAAGANLAYELLTRNGSMLTGGTFLWDELAALALLDPDLVLWDRTPIRIEVAGESAGHLARDETGTEVEITTDAAVASAVDAFIAALGVGDPRPDAFEVAGSLSVRWDGTSCLAELPTSPSAGFYDLSFENTTDAPAVVAIVSVVAPHTWADVVAFATSDPPPTEVPEWIVLDLYAQAGPSATSNAVGAIPAGVAGPACGSAANPEAVLYVAGPPMTLTP